MSEDDDPTLDIDSMGTDTLRVDDGAFDGIVRFMRSHRYPDWTDPRLTASRIIIETGVMAVEITADDNQLAVREVKDES